jgi:tetratricopeptide (TPR) repeat protein
MSNAKHNKREHYQITKSYFMRTILSLLLLVCLVYSCKSQTAADYFNESNVRIQEGRYEEALALLDSSIMLKDDEFVAWYNRAIVKNYLGIFEGSIPDLDRAISLNPTFKKAYNARANVKQDITDYQGAMDDYNKALELDSNFIDALFNRAELYELLGKGSLACADYRRALSLGDELSENEVGRCNDSSIFNPDLHSILYLTKYASDSTYGYTFSNPIKVGCGPNGGPANINRYFMLLRDAQGKSIGYERIGSCCQYSTPNGFMGKGLLDKYTLYYLDEKGVRQETIVFMTFYDYEEPMIIKGFQTVKPTGERPDK